MKKIILSLLFFLRIFSLSATHNRAADLFYKRVAPFSNASGPVYTYSITLITYTDDGPGIADRCSDTIHFGDGSKAVANRINGTTASNCGCATGIGCGEIIVNEANYRVKKNIYSVIHTYGGQGSYTIHFSDFNRNANIANIPNSVNQPFYIEALIIINASTGLNSSPEPTNPPVDRGFIASCFYHNPVAFDADGDSLSYELIPCNVPGYTYPNDGTSATLNINTNGLLSWCNPQSVGEYNVVIRIKEWRQSSCGDYQLAGYITRDMQTLIRNTSSPAFVPSQLQDVCIAAGSTLTTLFNTGTQTGITGVQLYGSCVSLSQPPATITPTTGLGNTTLTWPTNCSLGQKQPHLVEVTYTVTAGGQTARVYRPLLVKIVPPTISIYDIHRDTGTVTLRWHSPGSCAGRISGYNIYRKAGTNSWQHGACETGVTASSGFNLVFHAQANDTSFTDAYLQPFANGSSLNYVVTAVTNDCQEGFAENAQTVSVLTGIKQISNDLSSASVYPNPFNEEFEINTGSQIFPELQISLYSSNGSLLFEQTDKPVANTMKIRNADLKPGLYLLRLKTPGGISYKKLVKN